MAVFVDKYNAQFGRMRMCHMIADTRGELLQMADKIGVHRKWLQAEGTFREHFDICLSKKAIALQSGAVEISLTELARILMARMAQMEKYLCG